MTPHTTKCTSGHIPEDGPVGVVHPEQPVLALEVNVLVALGSTREGAVQAQGNEYLDKEARRELLRAGSHMKKGGKVAPQVKT
jgi:hypothetical protein